MSRTYPKDDRHIVLSAFSMTLESHFSREMTADILGISEEEVEEILSSQKDIWDKTYPDEHEDSLYYESARAVQVYIPRGARKPCGCDDVQSEDRGGVHSLEQEGLSAEVPVQLLGVGGVSAPDLWSTRRLLGVLYASDATAIQVPPSGEPLPFSAPGRGWASESDPGSNTDREGESQVREGEEAGDHIE